jgi:hypothetical protein
MIPYLILIVELALASIEESHHIHHDHENSYVADEIPTLIFHGLNDNCQNNAILTKLIQNKTGQPAFCVGIEHGITSTWLTNFNAQAEDACEKVMNNPLISKAP